ncbi:MAG: hypothetical protein NTV87_05250, partial [Ignavibacteriae bacterium]|nr:hypothetical protein [Ignavibacteriota bacterium]
FKTRKAFLTGGGVAEKGKLISLNKSNLGYLYKNSELFAEAYSQYKLNPDFKKVNPKLYKYFIIMENTGNKVNYKEGKNFSGVSYEEDGNKWIRISYSYGELKEMFEKKFGYKDIDNLPPEDEDRVAEEFNKFMDSLGM